MRRFDIGVLEVKVWRDGQALNDAEEAYVRRLAEAGSKEAQHLLAESRYLRGVVG